MTIRLVLADDHQIVLNGLTRTFEDERGFRVVATAHDGDGAIEAVRKHQPDVLITDLHMPKKSGLDVVRELRNDVRKPRVVLFLATVTPAAALEAMRLGVSGIVLKEMQPRMLIQCVKKVHAGEVWLEKVSAAKALESVFRRDSARDELSAILTPREAEILELVGKSMRNRDIARHLSIAEGTVKIHLHNIYSKLQIDGRVELTVFAREKGLA